MFLDTPPRHRSRTEELRPFWQAIAHFTHRRYDPEIRQAEWGFLPSSTVGVLLRGGFTCQRQVEACPDWLLLTIPQLGRVGLGNIRRVLLYRRDIYRQPRCPADLIETRRRGDRLDERDVVEDLARAAAKQLMVERVLYGTEP